MTHGSRELDDDAAKLRAMGQDPGPEFADIFNPTTGDVLGGAAREAARDPLDAPVGWVTPERYMDIFHRMQAYRR